MQLSMDSRPLPTFITLHDAIIDSPVYRSTSLQFDDQLDLVEKWLESLSKHMKSYVDKMNSMLGVFLGEKKKDIPSYFLPLIFDKELSYCLGITAEFNLETNLLCKKVIPVGINDTMIDSTFTGAVIKSFSDALQTSLAFKTKLVADLEDTFIQPLQLFIKTQVREFKEFRKQHEKALERYEAQLYKYTSQSKMKEASAVREEAFRLYEARKSYVRMSSQHVARILHFRSCLEHFIVDKFSMAANCHLKDFEGGKETWAKLKSTVVSWKQWLADDKETCQYQLQQFQSSRAVMEYDYINTIRPVRDLEKYNVAYAPQAISNSRHSLDYPSTTVDQPSCKWGYLYVKSIKSPWARKWFFLNEGCFGSVDIRSSPKNKGAITVSDGCVSVLLSDVKPVTDTVDRRHCFEVLCANQPSFTLQAETEQEMHEWLGAFESAKQRMLQQEPSDVSHTTPTYLPMISSSPPDTVAADHQHDSTENEGQTLTTIRLNPPTSMLDSLLVISSDISHLSSKETPKDDRPQNGSRTSATVVVSTIGAEKQLTQLNQSPSLTPLLVIEATKTALHLLAYTNSVPSSPTKQTFSQPTNSIDATLAEHDSNDTSPENPDDRDSHPSATNNHSSSSSWGIPWALVPSMFSLSHSAAIENDSNGNASVPNSPTLSSHPDVDQESFYQRQIWPKKIDQLNMLKTDVVGYSSHLDSCNKELRVLFNGVDPNEIVLTDFIGILKRMPPTGHAADVVGPSETPPVSVNAQPNNNIIDTLEQELDSQLSATGHQQPTSKYGYTYTGHAFITQSTFWFYSCILMNCINTVAVGLNDIKTVRLARDPSIIDNGSNSNLVLVLELANNNSADHESKQLIFSTLMDDIELVAERLKFILSNAKSSKPEPAQIVYDVIQNMSTAVNRNTTITNYSNQNIHKPIVDRVRSASDITSESMSSSSSPAPVLPSATASSITLESPKPSRSTDTRKKPAKTPRKHSAPVQPGSKSGALAAAMMAATVAGGSGFFDAGRSFQSPSHELMPLSAKRHDETKFNSNNGNNNNSNGKLPSSKKSLFSTPNDSKHSMTSSSVENGIHTVPKSAVTAADTVSPKSPHAPPDTFKAPVGPVSCGCDNHLDKLEAELKLPVSARHLYYILFSGANPNYRDIWEKKTAGNKNLTITKWEPVNGKKERTLKYIIPVNNAIVKLKEAEVVEKQVLEKEDNYLCYVVTTSTKAAELPYADAFVPHVKYCITWISPHHCKLCCYTGVKFLKNILVKGMVNKTAMKGMAENLGVFTSIIKREAEKQTLVKTAGHHHRAQKETGKKSAEKENTQQPSSTSGTSNDSHFKQYDMTFSSLVEWQKELKKYIDVVGDIVQGLPPIIKITAGSLLLLFMIVAWFTISFRDHPTSMASSADKTCGATSVISRAVYLKEVDESLLRAINQTDLNYSESFRLFMDSRTNSHDQQEDPVTGTKINQHRWYYSGHHQFATDILFSRQRLAMVRYDMLVLFQLLNDLDVQLLQDEYVNWLMDRRMFCRDPDTDFVKSHCDDVRRQLKLYSTQSHQNLAYN
ncbi:hypothetical protein BDF20DRAFT_910043 [Mycotypha africana]|uniref:uncharacterized protein n=1 Tax=Mycotypha africana TaxID=64632 RepID=UPI002300E1D8|nr:uncharacterized protein BDF20DRAFT_910043 [Mycotypha africana]KAI8987418.1 hypothetical protein BDF20DRAFT_910043 [Mycotypha africana]